MGISKAGRQPGKAAIRSARREAGADSVKTRLAIWLWLAGYLAAFLLLPVLAVPATGTLERWQLLVGLLLPEEVAARWVEDFALASLVQRGEVLLLAAAIFVVAVSAGWICLELAGLNRALRRLEQFVFAAGVGLNLVSLATLGLGLGGWLQTEVFFGAAAVIVIVAAMLVWRKRKSQVAEAQSIENLEHAEGLQISDRWLWLAAPFVLAIVASAMLPPMEFDVREYHLQAPKEFYQAGRITFLPHNVYASMPLGTEMLTLVGMIVAGDWWLGALVGKTLTACFAPLGALALLAAGRRFVSPAAGVIAALVYISTPWVALVSTQGLIEGALAFYWMLAVYGIGLWQAARDAANSSWRLLALAGFMAGGAAACKYPAVLFCVLPLATWVGCQGALSVGGGKRICLRSSLRSLAVFLLFCGLGCGLWYGKNLVLTGNPTYPLLANFFESATRTPELTERWNHAHAPPNFAASDLLLRVALVTLASDWLSPLVISLAALGLVVAGKRRLAWELAAYLAGVFVLWWLLTHRIDRFLVPALPLAALLAAIGGAWSNATWWRATLAVTMTAGLVYDFAIVSTGVICDTRYVADLATLRVDPERVDRWHLYLNEHAADVTGVLLVGDAQPFDLEVPTRYNTVFDPALFEQIARGRSSREIHESLARENISHIYVAWGEIARYRSPGNYGMSDFVQPEVFERLLSDRVLERVPPIKDHPSDLFRVSPLRPDLR